MLNVRLHPCSHKHQAYKRTDADAGVPSYLPLSPIAARPESHRPPMRKSIGKAAAVPSVHCTL